MLKWFKPTFHMLFTHDWICVTYTYGCLWVKWFGFEINLPLDTLSSSWRRENLQSTNNHYKSSWMSFDKLLGRFGRNRWRNGLWVEGSRSSPDLSEEEKDWTGFQTNLAGSMPNVAGSETNIVRSKQIYAKHCWILENLR